jgi:hypothetical protein
MSFYQTIAGFKVKAFPLPKSKFASIKTVTKNLAFTKFQNRGREIFSLSPKLTRLNK